MTVVLATCRAWPDLSRSDRRLRDALVRRGIDVRAAPWNGDPRGFESADLVILRACWDYHADPDGFIGWLDRLERDGVAVLNPPPVVRWNVRKTYLLDLMAQGLPVPRARIVDPGDGPGLRTAMAAEGWERAVLKPLIGQSGHHVQLLTRDGIDGFVGSPAAAGLGRAALLQAFQPEIAARGETACIFFDGAFSHAARKVIAQGEWRANSQYGAGYEPAAPPSSVVEAARRALAAVPGETLYARVDGIAGPDGFTIMEVEVIEPGLYLDCDPGAADRFADAIQRRLARRRAACRAPPGHA